MIARMGTWLGRRRKAVWDIPYEPAATADDVFHCFRLLLGRHPHREEWPGHSAHIGQPLPGVVAGYLNSLECTRRGLLAPPARPSLTVAELDAFRIWVQADDAAVGRHVLADNYERDVTAVFRRTLRPGMGVIDLGANIGYFTLLSAALVGPSGSVLAVEPNPANARMLEASRALNGFDHVMVAQVAAGRDTGLLVLNTSHSNGTTSAAPDDIDRLLAAVTVPSVRLDALVAPDRRVDLIKVDVEGAEYNALLGGRETIARCRPAIITEFSPELMPGISGIDGEGYLGWLTGQGYELSVIQPDGSLRACGADRAAVMREYAARGTDHIDLLALPAA